MNCSCHDIRALMRDAAEHTTKAYSRECGGRVRVHDDLVAMDHNKLLVEARIGCSQKCGCLSATAEIVTIDGVQYVQARCNADPNALALGDRILPDPDSPRRKR